MQAILTPDTLLETLSQVDLSQVLSAASENLVHPLVQQTGADLVPVDSGPTQDDSEEEDDTKPKAAGRAGSMDFNIDG